MLSALTHYEFETELRLPEDYENNKKEVKHLNKQLKEIQKTFVWLKKNKKLKK